MNSLVADQSIQSPSIFLQSDLNSIDLSKIPHHIAFIMDGNRRWAANHELPLVAGHWKGAERMDSLVQAACKLGIKVLTLFSFSTENWKRSQEEINALMELCTTYLDQKQDLMIEQGVKLAVIGDIEKLPSAVRDSLNRSMEATAKGENLTLVLAINYGGRDDLKRAFDKIADDLLSDKISREEISEQLISSYLDTASWPDPDLLIRTSSEYRISNFLLWQLSYSEIVISDKMFPDFMAKDLLDVIATYQNRKRRWGGA